MLSLCMIVKDEIKYIEDCLKAVKPYVSEMIVVDTGSTDGTKEILEKYGCKVFNFDWCDDFAKARNFSISKSSNNWVLILDADEIVTEFDLELVKKFIKSNNNQVIGMVHNKSYLGDLAYHKTVPLPRLFNKKYFMYEGAIHEQPRPKFNFNIELFEVGIKVDHFGYLNSTREDKDKSTKYLKSLKSSLENKYDPYIVHHLAGTYLNIGDYEQCIIEADKVLNDQSLTSKFYFINTVIIKIKALMQLEKYEDALKMQEHFATCQNDDEYLYVMAGVFTKNKVYSTAIDIYTILYNKKDLNMSKVKIVYEMGNLYFETKNYIEALKWFELIDKFEDVKQKIVICNENIK